MASRRRGPGGGGAPEAEAGPAESWGTVPRQLKPQPSSPGASVALVVVMLVLAALGYVGYKQMTGVGRTRGPPRQRLAHPHHRGMVHAEIGGEPQHAPAEPAQAKSVQEAPAPFQSDGRTRIIVLGEGGGLWNTGVWTGWGYGKDVTLNWAAAGVKVHKQCQYSCNFVRDEGAIASADAWVAETVNHEKFLGAARARELGFPFPARHRPAYATPLSPGDSPPPGHILGTADAAEGGGAYAVPEGKAPALPLRVQFYYDNTIGREEWTTDPALVSQFDVTMTPDLASTLPVSLVCPWGRDPAQFLAPHPPKRPDRFMAYFSEHGPAPSDREWVRNFIEAMGPGGTGAHLHSYIHWKNTELPVQEASGEPFQLSTRIDFIGTYKFLFITDAVLENSFLNPEFSQAILAGTVPVVLGAPNVDAFAPVRDAFINARDFDSVQQLVGFLEDISANDAMYEEFFDWKQEHGGSLPPAFAQHLSHCAHLAECRLCEYVHRHT